MALQPERRYQGNSRINSMTTLFASGWGLVSAYILFNTLFNQPNTWAKLFTVLAALCPLIAVWATIERKRWGRLALLGLSATAIGLFVAAAGAFAAIYAQAPTLADHLADDLKKLPFYESPTTICVLVLFAFANALWLRRPAVAAEFNQNKRPTLAIAQRVIATSLVGCWGVIVVASTYLPGTRLPIAGDTHSKAPTTKSVRNKHSAKHVKSPSAAVL